MWCIIIAIAFEYLFLIVNIAWIVRGICAQRKEPKKKVKSFVVYKWVKKSTLENSVERVGKFQDSFDISKSLSPNKRRGKVSFGNTLKKKENIKVRRKKSRGSRLEDDNGSSDKKKVKKSENLRNQFKELRRKPPKKRTGK